MIPLQVTEESRDKTLEYIHDAEVHLDLKFKMIHFLGLVDGEPYWEVSIKDSWVTQLHRKVVKVVYGFKVQHETKKKKLKRVYEQTNSMDNVELKKELLEYQLSKGYSGLERLVQLKETLLEEYKTVTFLCYVDRESIWYIETKDGSRNYFAVNNRRVFRQVGMHEIDRVERYRTKYGNSEITTYVLTNGKYPLHEEVPKKVARKMEFIKKYY
ncbi:hypothetical protein ACQUY5_27115 [Bacillus cereus]|uniref:hypothetical protein n=1 Tax=Bacillus cereus TaxID=1396 RepID=UPI003D17E373